MGGKDKTKKHGNKKIKDPQELQEETSELTLFTDQQEALIFFFVSTLSQAVYYLTMYPSLAGGDSGELMTVAVEFGVAHPPGYPLITLLGCVFNKLLPVGTPVWRLNLLNTIFSGLSNGVIYLVVKQVTYNNPAAVLTALWCAFSRLHWTWSLHYEVFSLNNLLTGLIILTLVKFTKESTSSGMIRGAKVCAVMCGLAMANQHTSILTIAPGALWVLASLIQGGVTHVKVLGTIALHGLAGLLLYLQIPLSALIGTARHTWNDQSSVVNSLLTLKEHVLREQYGTFKLHPNEKQTGLSYNLLHWFNQSTTDFTIFLWLISFTTILFSNKLQRGRRDVRLLAAMLGFYTAVFCTLANHNVSAVLERFWMQPNVLLLCIAGVGLGEVLTRLEAKLSTPWSTSGYTLIITLLITWQIQRNYLNMDQSNNNLYKHYADHVLANAPRGTLILASGDAHITTFWYHIFGEDRRTDLCPILPIFVRLPWYRTLLAKLCPNMVLRDQSNGRTKTDPWYNWTVFFDDNYDRRSILICGLLPKGIESANPGFQLWPWGLCHLVVRVADNKDYYNYILNDAPKIDLDHFPSQLKYRPQYFFWENALLEDMVDGVNDAVKQLHDTAADERNVVRQRAIMQLAKETLETALIKLYRDSDVTEFEPGKRDLRMRLRKTLGHGCLLQYMITEDKDSKVELEKCSRHSLKVFVEHEEQADHRLAKVTEESLAFARQCKGWLALPDYSSLSFV